MAITDPIADALTILRNASAARKDVAEIKNSKMMEAILRILKQNSFILNYKMIEAKTQGKLRIYLGYGKDGAPGISGLKRISRPGLRTYKQCDELPRVYSGLGVAIISTSKGLLTDEEARAAKIGGEVVCYAW